MSGPQADQPHHRARPVCALGATEVAEVVEVGRHDPELVEHLHVLNHRQAVVASAGVLDRFRAILDQLVEGLDDRSLTDAVGEKVMHTLADLTIAMRQDILQEVDLTGQAEALGAIQRNSRWMETLDDLDSVKRQFLSNHSLVPRFWRPAPRRGQTAGADFRQNCQERPF